YPYATGDHQIHNARYFTENGAAELLRDEEVNAETLRSLVEQLLSEETRRKRLANNMGTLATPEAADEVAGRLLAAATKQKGKLP
ncbi:MAG: UDP-N-acetylglucosamine--N-acetylmuramyl-(pentapeptide) pyrophosphoryl-undecaprenol, partial [Rubrobacteraceae bacterium]|nr:UDP-N-acetylglucosamine--N-acetylmuramyl-(pentapeptide) pyrophosphoryl-undecaprenol [Rubrobacteraceae bacterium]